MPSRWRTAAWLLAPPAWCGCIVGVGGLVLAGPLALLLIPVALPPMALLFVQARQATKVLRGHVEASGPLLVTACLAALLLLAGAAIGLPGPLSQPPGLRDVPRDVLLGIIGLVGAAGLQATAAALLFPPLRGRSREATPAGAGPVSVALVALAVAQVVVLTRPGDGW